MYRTVMHGDTGFTVVAAQGGGEVAAVLRGRFLSRSPGELTTQALGIRQRTPSGGHILDTVGESRGFLCFTRNQRAFVVMGPTKTP